MRQNKSTMIMLNPNHSDAVVPKKLETKECKGACRYIFVLDNNIFLSPIQDLEIRTYRIIILPAFVWVLNLVCRPKKEQKLRILLSSISGNFSLNLRVHIGSEAHPAPYPMGTRERAPGTHWIGVWVGLRADMDAEVKRKIPSPCRALRCPCSFLNCTA